MIAPTNAAWIMAAFIVLFGVVVPFFNVFEKTRAFVSLRWIVVVTFLCLSIGATLDFSHLENSTRMALIIGGLVIGGLWLLIRTWEKAKAKGYTVNLPEIDAKKGDISLHIGDDRRE